MSWLLASGNHQYSHDIDSAWKLGSCIPRGRISTTCAILKSTNSRNIIPHNNSALEELTIHAKQCQWAFRSPHWSVKTEVNSDEITSEWSLCDVKPSGKLTSISWCLKVFLRGIFGKNYLNDHLVTILSMIIQLVKDFIVNKGMSTWLGLRSGLILGLRPANERRCDKVTPSLIGWEQT